MAEKLKNLSLELSELEEEIIGEFCLGNRLDKTSTRDEHGRETVIVTELGYTIANFRVLDASKVRTLEVEIVGLDENKQETRETEDPTELIKVLLFIQSYILEK